MALLQSRLFSLVLAIASAQEVVKPAVAKGAHGYDHAMLQVETAEHVTWARFSGLDCVKQVRASDAQCIPCKKKLPDGSEVNRFQGNCKRDATVLASQIFTPWHVCGNDGQCPQGRLPKFRGRLCWAFNRGEFSRYHGPAGVCIKDWWRSRHIPTVAYAKANMAHGWKNVADFVAAYQWSMEQRESWNRTEVVMTCQLFCGEGNQACGKVGDCTCGELCAGQTTTSATQGPTTTEVPEASMTEDPTEEPSTTTVAPRSTLSPFSTAGPTPMPTPAPNPEATAKPSPTPTTPPTPEPTNPTSSTFAPTHTPEPTRSPSNAPTSTGRSSPTTKPTPMPTPARTPEPTANPSPTLTAAPTPEPTPSSTMAPTAASTATPTPAPVPILIPTPEYACTDADPTGWTLRGTAASCRELASFCGHTSLGLAIQRDCPVTCGAGCQCMDAEQTGFRVNGMVAGCAQLSPYCQHVRYGERIKRMCPEACGVC